MVSADDKMQPSSNFNRAQGLVSFSSIATKRWRHLHGLKKNYYFYFNIQTYFAQYSGRISICNDYWLFYWVICKMTKAPTTGECSPLKPYSMLHCPSIQTREQLKQYGQNTNSILQKIPNNLKQCMFNTILIVL